MRLRPRRAWLIAAGCTLALTIALGAAGLAAWRVLHTPLEVAETGAWLDVEPGTPLARLSARLADRGLLEHPQVLTLYARLRGDATRIKVGEYRLEPGTTPIGLLDKLVAGQVHLHQLTVVEGWRFQELLAAVREHPAILSTAADSATIMAELGSPDLHPEGQFFPDTYRFARGTADLEFLRQAHEAMRRRLAEIWETRQPGIVLQTPYEALILASIIEKETGLAAERRRIAGVFHRRLQRGMRLQTDPTVIYGLGETFDGNLRRPDLGRDTPYNTYTRAGLPPTPIALPGAAALTAAVDPEIGDALYFVATGLPDGSHHFSTTLEEHNQAVESYLQRLRESAAE